jgi:hypothetical protein
MGLSRARLFTALGIIEEPGVPRLHRRTQWAYKELEFAKKNTGRFRSSFWAGSFPAGDTPHCGRLSIYRLLNIPEANAAKPLLAAAARAGIDVENQITYRWGHAGITLGGSVPIAEGDRFEQLRLQDPEHWISAAIDGTLDMRPEHPAVVCVDVKSKREKFVNELKVGARKPDPRHVGQVVANIHLCRKYHEEMGWAAMGLEPCTGGFVYYVSREDPSNGKAFWVPYDATQIADAIARLDSWRESFSKGDLPARPKEMRWSEDPCKWCDFKKTICKPDDKEGVSSMFESHAIKYGKAVDSSWDPKKIQQEVLDRWS